MKRILFVDDDQRILDSLQRMLRPMRHEWDMKFVASGEAAMEVLQAVSYDVVVSDMRMPAMDGASLLAAVRDHHPAVARVVLSGQTEREAALRSVRVAHQHLHKPCDPQELKTAVERVCALGDLLRQEELRRLLAGLSSVPSLPSVYESLRSTLDRDDVTYAEIGDIVEQDPGLTAKLLQVVNSAFFSLPRKLTRPHEAVSLLGTELMRALVLSAAVFRSGDPVLARRFNIAELWQQSLQSSVLARRIAADLGMSRELQNCAQAAGMLHALGQVVLAFGKPEAYAEALDRAGRDNVPLHVAEDAVLGSSSAHMGAYLLGLWGLPPVVVEAVAFHAEPLSCPHDKPSAVTAVHAGVGLLAEERNVASSFPLCEPYLDKLGLKSRLAPWRSLLASSV